jgi:hypothetical protein
MLELGLGLILIINGWHRALLEHASLSNILFHTTMTVSLTISHLLKHKFRPVHFNGLTPFLQRRKRRRNL